MIFVAVQKGEENRMAEIKVPIRVNLPDDWLEQIVNRLRNDPEAEWVEIIRCKDCKHYQFADNRAFGMPVKMCEWFGFEDVDDDDFCSRAERREE